jgi:hypothetical protein
LGDIRVENGIEYMYARNRKFGSSPYEPEYMWVRKDEATPSMFESLAERLATTSDKKEIDELKKRIAKLEAELKGGPPRAQAPAPLPVAANAPVPPPSRPQGTDTRLKRRVLVLPTGYKEDHLDDLVMRRLVPVLERAGCIVSADRHGMDAATVAPSARVMKTLDREGVQAVVIVSLSVDKSALLTMCLDVYSTETGGLLRRILAHSPTGMNGQEGDRAKAVDLTIDLVKEDLAKTVRSFAWHARIVSIDNGRTMLNAGALSGVKEGDLFEVYGRGEQVIDRSTGLPLGTLKGTLKGEIEVSRVSEVDASWARTVRGGPFAPGDIVYLKK